MQFLMMTVHMSLTGHSSIGHEPSNTCPQEEDDDLGKPNFAGDSLSLLLDIISILHYERVLLFPDMEQVVLALSFHSFQSHLKDGL